ncbi:MAG: exopolysaccharide biosynthesis protein [Rhizobiaceae bacterium]|nr:exopolysaccharide biosynthesis protein [Rhizobiaceae bacterium]
MSVAPSRKKSKAVFWIAAIAIGSIILATALLANNMRNLKALAARYHLNLFDQPASQPATPSPATATPQTVTPEASAPKAVETTTKAATTEPAKAVTPPSTKTKPAETTAAAKPEHATTSHLFDPPVDALRGAFLRGWRLSGPAMCANLEKSGLAVGEWKQSAFATGTSECSYQIQKGGNGEPGAASFFIIARGSAAGELDNVRIKVIMPDNANGRAIGETFVDAVVQLLTDTHWLDFEAALDSIGKLQDVTLEAFGTKLSFFREFQDNRSFNLQLTLTAKTPEQIRTAAVFDPLHWTLPSPPPSK